MADKEATVFIVDLGATMADCSNSRAESNLDWSMRYVWDKLSTTVAASRKTLCVGVVGFRTDETKNDLTAEDGYENISVLQSLGPMYMQDMKRLQKNIKTSDETTGDAISAIVVAIDMIEKFTKKLKYKRRIILVTDGEGPMDADGLDDISKKINEVGIELMVLGVDFDDPEYGFKEEDKSKTKSKNEKRLSKLVENCEGGVFGTIAEAINELDTPRIKTVRPYKNYDGVLTLGNQDPDEAGTPRSISISVERYFKTHHAAPPSATTVVVRVGQGEADTMEGIELSGEFSAVKNARTYKVSDPDAPGGKRDVEYDNLAKGYEYGRTAVHISESEHNITKIETEQSFSIIGFIPWHRVEPFLSMGECCQIVASRFNETSAIALSSLVHALWELESFAVARLVPKMGKEPQLVLLMPGPEATHDCLYDVPLPFAEDVRSYQFPPLDKVVTIGGATLTKHRNLPNEDLVDAMSEYVDAMDLSNFGLGDDGHPTEYCSIDENYNPTIHRLNAMIRSRAVNPDEPVGPAADILLRYSKPPEDLITRAQPEIDSLIEVADVKKVPPKVNSKRKQREVVKPLSGLDIEALLAQGESEGALQISPENSVPEFKRALASADDESTIEEAVRQLGKIIRNLVKNSLGDSGYDRAAENMRVMRNELIKFEEPGMYNSFIRDLKKEVLSGTLGGDRREMWFQIRAERLGLIDKNHSELSDVSSQDASEFYMSRQTV